MNKKIWTDHPERAAQLAALLHDPVLQDALAVLTELAIQPLLPVIGAKGMTATLTEVSALSGATRDGYIRCLEDFKDLAKPQIIKNSNPRPWISSAQAYEEAKKLSEERLKPVTP